MNSQRSKHNPLIRGVRGTESGSEIRVLHGINLVSPDHNLTYVILRAAHEQPTRSKLFSNFE